MSAIARYRRRRGRPRRSKTLSRNEYEKAEPHPHVFIAAGVLVFSGTVALLSFAVPSIKQAYGITESASAFAFLIIAPAQLVLGGIAWSVRKDPDSKTRTTLAHGYASLFFLWALVDVVGTMGAFRSIPGHDNSLWLWVAIFSSMALGFFVAGRTRG